MKLKNILFAAFAATALASCNDYLDVDAPSKQGNEYVYHTQSELPAALNGVYAQLMDGDFFGNAWMSTFQLNSDVDFATNSGEVASIDKYQRFDCSSSGSAIKKLWDAGYTGIYYANSFIKNLETSPLFNKDNSQYAEMLQMLGEARVIRAMYYHELMWYFGDVPFTLEPTSTDGEVETLPVKNRWEIQKILIDDLKEASKYMNYAKDLDYGVERVSKEFAWAMIARIAMQAAGYTLVPDGNTYGKMARPDNYMDFYEIAAEYADSVIAKSGHALTKSYKDVFVDECNYIVADQDDPIFEIPFAAGGSGNVGYIHGPQNARSSDGTNTANNYGYATGGTQVSYFYRFFFKDNDLRRKYVNGMWYYTSPSDADGKATTQANLKYGLTLHNNKWSKLWQDSPMGSSSAGSTGINFPYMRYADVLLMFAEAANELDNAGITPANPYYMTKQDALKQVRNRAFDAADQLTEVEDYVNAMGDYDSFKKGVIKERMLEFAGENMRWKDLVRTNEYNKAIYWTFYRYLGVANVCDDGNGDGSSGSAFLAKVSAYDGVPATTYEKLPTAIYAVQGSYDSNSYIFPNTSLPTLKIINPDEFISKSQVTDTKATSVSDGNYRTAEPAFNWVKDDGVAENSVNFSLFGYIRGNSQNSNVYVINNGTPVLQGGELDDSNLPVLRYILPYPNDAIQRSGGVYKNQYGYTN